ncbi:TMAO reductase system periplasmic protein TorT [Roseateles koreensis]|uniref:TMAO reductase system periplasmic protein TorT n=1 Tax=Roseateles koreensis TaxID=2987526 RepID=A0ABT5KV46_9BURK|nr:TMAO reductase system periplasmic protein TorT [Roseateles koreensis]MDC8786804.1 TMAO reductase system periplasmic protein TorT [Roseateles koreensis]
MNALKVLTLCGTLALPAVAAATAVVTGFEPIVTYSIFPPLKANGTADDALATGQVKRGYFPMAERASKPWRIAFLFPHIKDPYWVGCNYGVITEAKRLGVAATIFVADGYDDVKGQLRKMAAITGDKFDAIVLSPIDLTANNPSIAWARSQGIPVFELANDSTSDDLTVKVTTSLKGMGEEAARWMIHDALRRGLKTVNVALLPGPRGAGWVSGEVNGTREVVSKAPLTINIVDVKYGDSDRHVQGQLARQVLREHGKSLDYIIGCTGCAPPASAEIREAKLQKQVKVIAYDLTREIAGLIQQGHIAASVDTKAVSQARVVTDSVVNYLEGRTANAPHTILIKLGLVDESNYATYKFDTSIAPDDFVPVFSQPPVEEK